MREAEVVDVFEAWLRAGGWQVRREVDCVDLLAEHRDGRLLYVEAKGSTSSPGLDVDTQYGQLLRRMEPEERQARYALVVPVALRAAVLRVQAHVRALLRVDVFLVNDQGEVLPVDEGLRRPSPRPAQGPGSAHVGRSSCQG